jgi:hypothetical protein
VGEGRPLPVTQRKNRVDEPLDMAVPHLRARDRERPARERLAAGRLATARRVLDGLRRWWTRWATTGEWL